MPFPLMEQSALLALKGVGPAVIARLEQMGIDSLAVLGKANVCDILAQASAAVGYNPALDLQAYMKHQASQWKAIIATDTTLSV